MPKSKSLFFSGVILAVTPATKHRWLGGVGPDATFADEADGHYITLTGNASFYTQQDPKTFPFSVGDSVIITISPETGTTSVSPAPTKEEPSQ